MLFWTFYRESKQYPPTCLVASDSCCSILSTTFLKGGLLRGSASQQDRIISYLHSSMQTHKHFYFSTGLIALCLLFSVLSSIEEFQYVPSSRYAGDKPNATGWEKAAFSSPRLSTIASPSIQPPCFPWSLYLQFASKPVTYTHIHFQQQLTFHWVQTLEHPFCILLLSVCRTWHPQAYQDKDCFLRSTEIQLR